MKNIIIHIPHDGHQFPEELKEFCIISDEELQHYDYEMSDINLNHIVETLPFTKISFPISRLFCDVERFDKDFKEPMSKVGMGMVYSKDLTGKTFVKTDNTETWPIISIVNGKTAILADTLTAIGKTMLFK